jgi:hypothetical protein
VNKKRSPTNRTVCPWDGFPSLEHLFYASGARGEIVLVE